MNERIRSLLNTNESWTLKLTNHLGWSLSASMSTKIWLRRLASIMDLKRGRSDGLRKVHFVLSSDFGDSSGLPNLHVAIAQQSSPFVSNWTTQKFGLLRWWSSPGGPEAICELPDLDNMENGIMMMSEALLPLYRQTIAAGGMPMHAALMERSGVGFLIAASGGVGKSTCCHRLPPPWNPLCDVETLILPASSKSFLAHPFPTWSEYLNGQSSHTWRVESCIPLDAVFFLSQAATDEVVPISKMEAAIRINQSAVQVCNRMWFYMTGPSQRGLRSELFSNASNLAKAIPCFELSTSLTGRFWEHMDRVLPQVKA